MRLTWRTLFPAALAAVLVFAVRCSSGTSDAEVPAEPGQTTETAEENRK